MPDSITIASVQARAVYQDISETLNIIKEKTQLAEDQGADIICFPECFLQGYILDEEKARSSGLSLDSKNFNEILETLKDLKPTIILGLIERNQNKIYNTAIIIENGHFLGKYSKRHIMDKEKFFTPGSDNPVFESNNIKFGINICYDGRFIDSAKELARNGAQIIFYPLNNSLPHETAQKWKDKHIDYHINTARETGCYVVSSDIVEEGDLNTGYGCTALIDGDGFILKYLKHSVEDIYIHTISF